MKYLLKNRIHQQENNCNLSNKGILKVIKSCE